MLKRQASNHALGSGSSAPKFSSCITCVLVALLTLGGSLGAKAETDADSVAALRQLVEQQNRKLDELNEKVRLLEEKDKQRETVSAEPRLPAILIDTNGVPLGTIATAEAAEKTPTKPLPQISAGADGFSFRSADSNFVMTLHGLVQFDSRTFFDPNPYTQGEDGFLLRRARPILAATMFRDYDFLLVPDFGGSSVQLFDASVNCRFAPWLQLKAGKFKGPVGLEQLQTDAAASFNERSLASDLVPMRDVGIQLGGDVELGKSLLTWAVGAYDSDGDGRLAGNSPNSNDIEFGGRLFWQPFKNDSDSRLRGLGFGAGGSYCNVSSNSAALPATTGGTLPGYWTTGQQQFFAYNPLLGPVVADGPHWRISPEAYYYVGPFGVQAEYIISDQRVQNTFSGRSVTLENTAWQVTAQWMITGENASFNAITPARPFDLHAGGWGAWQLVARLSQLDMDPNAFKGFADAATSAHSATEWSVGLNWWLNANVRWLVGFSHTTFQGGGGVNSAIPSTTTAPATVTAQDESVLFTRIQLAF